MTINSEQKNLAQAIFLARYRDKLAPLWVEYRAKYGVTRASVDFLLDTVSELLCNPISWSEWGLPSSVLAQRDFFATHADRAIGEAREQLLLNETMVVNFLNTNHVLFKYALNRWLFVNPGIAFEQYTINLAKIAPAGQLILQKHGVNDGASVIHLHIISNQEREKWNQVGLSVPDLHWCESYYRDALAVAAHAVSHSHILGLFCQDSWVFDPALFGLASDGKPFAAFSWLANEALVGERFFVAPIEPNGPYASQFEFAMRSPRRRDLYERGEFRPRTFGFFYAAKDLKVNGNRA